MLEVHRAQITLITIAVILVVAGIFYLLWRMKEAAIYRAEQEVLRQEWKKQESERRFAEVYRTMNYEDGQDDCIRFTRTNHAQ